LSILLREMPCSPRLSIIASPLAEAAIASFAAAEAVRLLVEDDFLAGFLLREPAFGWRLFFLK